MTLPEKLKKSGFDVTGFPFQKDVDVMYPAEFYQKAFVLIRQVVSLEVISEKKRGEKTELEILLNTEAAWKFSYFSRYSGSEPLSYLLYSLNHCLFQSNIPYQIAAIENSRDNFQIVLINQETYQSFKKIFVSFPQAEQKIIQFNPSLFADFQPLKTHKEIKADEKKRMKENPDYFEQNPNYGWLKNQVFETKGNKSDWYKLFNFLLIWGEKNRITKAKAKEAETLLEAIGKDNFLNLLPDLELYFKENEDWFYGNKSNLLRAFLWICTLLPQEKTYTFLRRITEKAYTKIRGIGAVSVKIGNAGIKVLASMESPEAMQELLRMKTRSKYPVFLKVINKALQKLAKSSQLNEHEILDRMTPDFGIRNAELEQKIGDYSAQVFIENYNKIHLGWLKADGKSQKSEPLVLKKNFASELKQFKSSIQEIKQSLQTQRYRLEDSWRNKRIWTFADWEKYIFRHELTALLSHSLIWEFENKGKKVVAIAENNKITDVRGNKISNLEKALVCLWHPVKASVKEVLAWRDYLFAKEIRQPFKQAFREVYVLTEAEKVTQNYSNRFSAHILQQNKLFALAQQRHWQYKGSYNYAYDSPTLNLPEYNLQVILDLSFPSWEYASTQRTIFKNLESEEAISLANIDKIAFSELMRDIDLFIAVCSIGSDPNWDGSDDYKDYWDDYSFGEKSETISAKNRKEILERIVPNTKIAKQCSFEGNFLIVEGKIKIYKINLGSGNILMKPHDEYLCIVPDRKSQNFGGKVFLPFEGDSILTLILSKAFLLAEDDKIKDTTILSQLKK